MKLKEDFKKWSPCKIEALAFAVAIDADYDQLRESKKMILICPDNKPVAKAVKLIKKGGWSSSLRMSRLISNVNKVPITVKHISGKFKLNPVADHQSQFPSDCSFDNCSICNFVSETANSVLDPAA